MPGITPLLEMLNFPAKAIWEKLAKAEEGPEGPNPKF